MYMSHSYIDMEIHDTITACLWTTVILIRYYTRYRSVHSYFMFLHHGYIDSPVYKHWLYMYSCCMDHGLYYYYMNIPVFHNCILVLILIFCYWIRELLICDVQNPTSMVFRFPLSCFMLSTELMSYYHVTCSMHCTCSCYVVYFKYNKDNLGMGRLDGWLDLIGWMYWIHIYPTTGDGSAGYRLYIAPWAPVSRFLLPS